MRLYFSLLLTITLLFPGLASAAGSIMFDRNGNGVPDIRFGEAQDGGGTDNANIVSFDNDEDGTYDFGFLSGGNVHDDGEIYGLWIDKNGDGSLKKNEVRTLPLTLQWATFPSSLSVSFSLDGKGTDFFMDYIDDFLTTARETARDLDGDGDIETDAFIKAAGAIGEGASDVNALMDTDNNSYFDRLMIRDGAGGTQFIDFPKSLQRHLPVLSGMVP